MQTKHPYFIQVSAVAEFVPDESVIDEARFVFSYRVTIRNAGQVAARLMTRHWRIIDAEGRQQEVRGEGVIGQQPLLAPGESFNYQSACALTTPIGTMTGTYQMIAADGTAFDAEIPEFLLAASSLAVLH